MPDGADGALADDDGVNSRIFNEVFSAAAWLERDIFPQGFEPYNYDLNLEVRDTHCTYGVTQFFNLTGNYKLRGFSRVCERYHYEFRENKSPFPPPPHSFVS